MKVSLPYSRGRRYLTGVDWFVGTLAHSAQASYGVGGISQAILEVEGVLDAAVLRGILREISGRFPLIHGRVARDWLNLAPFWKVRGEVEEKIPLRVVDLKSGEEGKVEGLFFEHVNTPFGSRWEHVRFLLVRCGGRSRLGMAFDHRLLDAFGSELFFRLIDLGWQGKLEEAAGRVEVTAAAHLDEWKKRFGSGRKLNEFLFELNRKKVCGLEMPADARVGKVRPIKFVHERMTAEESGGFNKRAAGEIGMPVILPAATARAMVAMRGCFARMGVEGEQLLAFTSANMRVPGREWESFFFNHFSLLPFSMDVGRRESVKEAAVGLRDQFFMRMKEGIPFAMQDAMMLGRICPLRVGSRLLRFVARGQLCSFYFACLRETGFGGGSFMGMRAVNLVHEPLVFSPPGLNVCMTNFGGRYNLVISYVEGVIGAGVARGLMGEFRGLLLS